MRLQTFIKKNSLAGLILSIILLQSCTKDQADSIILSDAESRITKVVFDSAYTSIGFTTLNYTDDKLVNIHMFDSIHNSSYDYDISYPAENQIKVTHRSNTNRYTLFSYNNNNQLAQLEGSYYSYSQLNKYIYTFHSSKNKIDSVSGYNPLITLWKYKYDANENIVQVICPQSSDGQISTIDFKYDNQPNLFQKNKLYFLIEYLSRGGNDLEDMGIPSLFSKNNIKSYEWNKNNLTFLNYITDSKGRLTKAFYNQNDGDAWKYYY